jgi:protein O-GlcNAc transferase
MIELMDQALALHRIGQLDQAAALYGQVLDSQPNHVDALHLLGVIAYQRGDDPRAVHLIRLAITLDSSQAAPHNHLGLALMRQGELDEAAAQFERALERDPAFAQAHNNLGSVRHQQGRLQEAAASYERALDVNPQYATAHFNLGRTRRMQGDLQGAAESFQHGTNLDPASADGIAGLADVLLALGRAAEAVVLYQRALVLAPDNAPWHCALGDAWHTLGDLTQAKGAYRQTLALDAAHLQAWWGRGCAEAMQGEHAAAAACFQQAVAIAPQYGEAHHNLGTELFALGQIDAAIEAFRRAAGLLKAAERSLGAIATIIPGSPGADNEAVARARRAWAGSGALAGSSARTLTFPVETANPRLRIGYISAFFQHAHWMKPVWGLINNHERGRFDVHLFSDAPRAAIQHGYRAHEQDRLHDLSGLSNAEAARVIEEQRLDLLVDLNAFSRLSRVPLLDLRPAPAIVAWFNLFAPSGLSCYDYVIGDRHVLPAEERKFYGQRVVRLRRCYLTFEVTYPVPDVAPAPCLSRKHVTFGCLCPQYKITPQVVETWSRILCARADSRLFLKNGILDSPENRRFVHELFARFGIGSDRVELEGRAEHIVFLGRYAEVDVALDPFPYNGGTTTMEALWQGVPVLTFSGDRWASRISASLMRSAGLPEFVAPNLDGYVRKAIDLASAHETPARLDELRRTMRDRLRCAPVCNVRAFARDMERVYLRIWRQRRDGRL